MRYKILATIVGLALTGCEIHQQASTDATRQKSPSIDTSTQAHPLIKTSLRKKLREQGYNICTSSQGYLTHDCHSLSYARDATKLGLSPEEVNPFGMLRPIVLKNLKDQGCNVTTLPDLWNTFSYTGIPSVYAEAVCTGEMTKKQIDAYPARFREDMGVVELHRKGVSPTKVGAYSPTFKYHQILDLHEHSVDGPTANSFATLIQRKKIEVEFDDIPRLSEAGITAKTATWYFNLEDRFDTGLFTVEDIIAFESEIKRGKTTKPKIQSMARKSTLELRLP